MALIVGFAFIYPQVAAQDKAVAEAAKAAGADTKLARHLETNYITIVVLRGSSHFVDGSLTNKANVQCTARSINIARFL